MSMFKAVVLWESSVDQRKRERETDRHTDRTSERGIKKDREREKERKREREKERKREREKERKREREKERKREREKERKREREFNSIFIFKIHNLSFLLFDTTTVNRLNVMIHKLCEIKFSENSETFIEVSHCRESPCEIKYSREFSTKFELLK
jgi:hypothetical protein